MTARRLEGDDLHVRIKRSWAMIAAYRASLKDDPAKGEKVLAYLHRRIDWDHMPRIIKSGGSVPEVKREGWGGWGG